MRSDIIKKGSERAPHRSLLRATEAREYIEALEEFLRQSAAAASAGRSSGQGPPPPV